MAAGNLLAAPEVIEAMVDAFENAEGLLAERLLAAMGAALAAGGEAGPVHSAALSVVGDLLWPVVDLRVDWAEHDPIGQLERLWLAYKPQMQDYVTRALDPTRAPSYGGARRRVSGSFPSSTAQRETCALEPDMPGSRDILADLVAFDTVSRESNLALIDYVRDYLAGFGVDSELFFDADGRKANLYATIGPSDRGGVCLSGHTDVVPADGQAWSVPPFRLSERDGRLYGRGTADMKGYLACVLAAVPAFLAAPLRLPVHLAFSYDEEVGCLGVRSLLAALERRPHKPLLCIIGEPTELKPVLGHKGKLAMRCEVHGAACHSAYAPQGVNAIEYAARLIGRLGEIGARLAAPERHDRRFDPPYSTVQTGLVQGGRALNIVPAECRFDFEVRALPADDPRQVAEELRDYAESELLPRMRAVERSTDIRFTPLSAYPGLLTADDSQAAELIGLLSGSTDFSTVAFGTEGGLFHQAGIPAVICGPGSMDQGHKPDEFVSLAQLEACDALLARLAAWLREP
ncbi:acetylornithine deacetylase [Pseudomonas aeruginosa]|nr:acetylornithine deacetylase [Pseudomonas aeruginosa]